MFLKYNFNCMIASVNAINYIKVLKVGSFQLSFQLYVHTCKLHGVIESNKQITLFHNLISISLLLMECDKFTICSYIMPKQLHNIMSQLKTP